MRQQRNGFLLTGGLLLMAGVLTGCSHSNSPATLEAQKADVMGGPAPASAQAQIDSLKAAQAQRQAAAQAADQQKAQAAAVQRK